MLPDNVWMFSPIAPRQTHLRGSFVTQCKNTSPVFDTSADKTTSTVVEKGNHVKLLSSHNSGRRERPNAFEAAQAELFKIVREPFSSLSDLKSKRTSKDQLWLESRLSAEEITLGVHLEWIMEPDLADTQPTNTDFNTGQQALNVLLNLEPGTFIGDAEPCGWEPVSTSADKADNP